MLCFKCRKEVPDDSVLCPYCGTRFTESGGPEHGLEKKSRRALYLGLSLAAVLLLVGGGVSLLNRNRGADTSAPPPETPAVSEPASAPTPTETASAPEPTARLTPAEAAANVLYLEVYDPEDLETCVSGSGFLIRDTRTLVTNYHVIDGGCWMFAMTDDGDQVIQISELLAWDEVADLAILRCDEAFDLSPLELADSDTVQRGDRIFAAGYPLGGANTLSDGIISSRYTDRDGVDILQITAPISHGSSGGALLNENGQVIGVTSASREDGQNLNFAIASNMVSALLEKAGEPVSLEDFYFEQHPSGAPTPAPTKTPAPANTPAPTQTPAQTPASSPTPTPEPTPEPTPAPTPALPASDIDPQAWRGRWTCSQDTPEDAEDNWFQFDFERNVVIWNYSYGQDVKGQHQYPFKVVNATTIEMSQNSDLNSITDRFVLDSNGTIVRTCLQNGQTYLLIR